MDGIAVIVVKRVDAAVFPNVFGASQNIIRGIAPTRIKPRFKGGIGGGLFGFSQWEALMVLSPAVPMVDYMGKGR